MYESDNRLCLLDVHQALMNKTQKINYNDNLEHCAPLIRLVIFYVFRQNAVQGRESLKEFIITNRHLSYLHQNGDRDIGFYFFHQSGDRDQDFLISKLDVI